MEITFLGTSAMVPTKNRNHTAVLLIYKGEGILFDCGEGTQRQLKIAGIKPTKVTKILISHWHGDHCLGLPGLIQTLDKEDYNKTLEIYGPVGIKNKINNMFKVFGFAKTINIKVKEIKKQMFFENNDFVLEGLELKHSIITLGYSFIEKDRRRINLGYVKKIDIPEGPLLGKLQEGKSIKWKGRTIKASEATYIVKGKKISYVVDTLPCKNALLLAKDSDLLISESTYTSDQEDKAEEFMHMTAKQAGLLANQTNSKKLILIHFSQRYKSAGILEEDARNVFDDVLAARDFMKIKI